MNWITERDWHKQRAEYAGSIVPFTSNYRQRKGKGLSHPIYDSDLPITLFLQPSLKRHPGYGAVLEVKDESQAKELLENPLYKKKQSGASLLNIFLSIEKIRERELKQLTWISTLSRNINQRAPRFSCLGLHEWAMVYKSQEHHPYPLRLSNSEIESFLDSSTIACSH